MSNDNVGTEVGGEANSDLEQRLTLYGIIFQKFNQEGDGIWSRFNVMASINLALLSAFGYLHFRENSSDRLGMMLALCVAGLIISAWSSFVLIRLWSWHQIWRENLVEIEKGFPKSAGWATPHLSLNKPRVGFIGFNWKKEGWARNPGYTQPFIWILIIAWISLLVYSLGNVID